MLKYILISISVILIVYISYLFIKKRSITKSEYISILAFIISVFVGLFNYFETHSPAVVDVDLYNLTLSGTGELNRLGLSRQILLKDISQRITPLGNSIANDIISKFGANKEFKLEGELLKYLDKTLPHYPLQPQILKDFLGNPLYQIPIAANVKFFNSGHSSTVVNELLLKLESKKYTYYYQPKYQIDNEKYYTYKFKKVQDYVKDIYYPVYLNGLNTASFTYLFISEKVINNSTNKVDTLGLMPDLYKVYLIYNYEEKIKEIYLRDLDVPDKLLFDLVNGGGAIMEEKSKLLENYLNK